MRFQKYPDSCGGSLNLLCKNGEGATTMITQMSWTHDGDDKENGKKVIGLD